MLVPIDEYKNDAYRLQSCTPAFFSKPIIQISEHDLQFNQFVSQPSGYTIHSMNCIVMENNKVVYSAYQIKPSDRVSAEYVKHLHRMNSSNCLYLFTEIKYYHNNILRRAGDIAYKPLFNYDDKAHH